MFRGGFATALLFLSAAAFASGDVDARLSSGATHFRAGDFDRALIEFKVARELGARGEVAWYIAAALTKLQRSEDAVEAFAVALAEAPDSDDALLGYYHAMACYDAQLLTCADQLLSRVGSEAGPRIREQATKVREQLAPLLKAEPPKSAIDVLLARGEASLQAGRPALAQAYFREAMALSGRRLDKHRSQEATKRNSVATAVEPGGRKP